MTTPIEVTRSKLPGNMAHMMPAQNTDPKEYRQVQRRKEDNVPHDLIGNVVWYKDERQPEPGYIIWRADKNNKQVIAHIEYIETEDAWFSLHYIKGIPYATIGSKILEGKYGLKRKGGKTPNLYLWRNDPEPLSEEENPVGNTDNTPDSTSLPNTGRTGSHNPRNGRDTRPEPTHGR